MANAPGLARRFYAAASVGPTGGGFTVKLDARTLRTPAGAPFVVPSRALAQACTEEWAAQGEYVTPATMPLTQLAFATLDWCAPAREERVAYVVAYGETDLCAHRAEAPEGLVARQAAAWDPIVEWAEETLGVRLPVVTGVMAAPSNAEALAALRGAATRLDDFRLMALTQAVGVTGSALIGFALLHRRLEAQAAFEAAALDDLWSQERWGEDAEARARLLRIRNELEALERFIAAIEAQA